MIPPSTIDDEIEPTYLYADNKVVDTAFSLSHPYVSPMSFPMTSATVTLPFLGSCSSFPPILSLENKRETNCPNCGAPITGAQCEYCDTFFVDPYILDKEKRDLEREINRLTNEFRTNKIAQTLTTSTYQYAINPKKKDKSLIKRFLRRRQYL